MPFRLYAPGTRKGNRYYVARITASGKTIESSTNTTDEKTARRVATEAERRLRDEQKRVPSGKVITFRDAAALYIEFRQPSKVDQQRIDKVVARLGRMKILDIRAADIHQLAVRLHPNDTAATRNRNVIRPAVTVLHHAANAGLCGWIKVNSFKEARPTTRALTPEAAAALIEAAESGPQRRLLVWLFLQGTRITATLTLQWDQIDLSARTVRLWNAKGDRWETFPLHDAVVAKLLLVSDRTGRVFPWSNRSSLRRWLPALCERVGIDMTPHMARHTLGTMMAANGETLRAIMAALGHSTPSSSVRYQGADIEMVRAATGRVKLPFSPNR